MFHRIVSFIPRVTSGFEGRPMIPSRMISPVLYLPVVYLGVDDRRLLGERREDNLFHTLIYQAGQPVAQLGRAEYLVQSSAR